ncbi:MAG TPA: hypothetical protein VI365_09625, partial [Trebonia sp.]
PGHTEREDPARVMAGKTASASGARPGCCIRGLGALGRWCVSRTDQITVIDARVLKVPEHAAPAQPDAEPA